MLKVRLAYLSLVTLILLSFVPALTAQTPAARLPSQILTAKKVFISNAGGLLDLNTVSGDPRRAYNQFYAAMQAWGHYSLVGSPAEADLIAQISIIYIPRQIGAEAVPFPSFRVALLDTKSNVTLWVLDEYLVEKPNLSLIFKKNRDKVFDEAIEKLVSDLKALTTVPADPGK
ncbi:MAG: hypothetical protein ABSE46_12005 [Terracidiphilus sp.]